MYDPQVNDYVRWTTELGMVHEGWVYYKGKPDDNAKRIKDKWVATSNYITIEIATKPRPQCDLSTFRHKRIHTCILCFPHDYQDLTYVGTRPTIHDGLDKIKDRFHGQEDQGLDREVEKEVTNA